MRTSRTPGQRLFFVLIAAYVGFMIAWNGILRLPTAYRWPVQLLSVFDPWLYLPVVPLLAAAVVGRHRRAVALLVLPAALFALQYGQLFVPAPHSAEGLRLRVMTANLQFENRDAAELADLLQERSPDIVAVQELGSGMSTPLAKLVQDQYPYRALYPDPSSGAQGMGVLSRYPILETRRPEMGRGQCACQQVTVDVKGQAVTILNVHPDHPSIPVRKAGPIPLPRAFPLSQQEQVLLAIRQRASTIRTPLIIMGDLNTSDHERTYPILAGPYHDTFKESGWGLGFTFPMASGDVDLPFPAIRIDYVFHDDSLASRSAQVQPVPGSDHAGVLAELALRQNLAQVGTGR